jgi:acyl-CoA thioesterase YciA
MTEKELVIKVVAMPGDTNPDGDMFGGWILSQMDLAAYLHARKVTPNKVVTVAIDDFTFHQPVFVGDCLICYASIEKVGRTSIVVHIEAIVERKENHRQEKVTEGNFIFVAIGPDRRPVPIVAGKD